MQPAAERGWRRGRWWRRDHLERADVTAGTGGAADATLIRRRAGHESRWQREHVARRGGVARVAGRAAREQCHRRRRAAVGRKRAEQRVRTRSRRSRPDRPSSPRSRSRPGCRRRCSPATRASRRSRGSGWRCCPRGSSSPARTALRKCRRCRLPPSSAEMVLLTSVAGAKFRIAPPSLGPGPVTWLSAIVELTTSSGARLTIAPPLCPGPALTTVFPEIVVARIVVRSPRTSAPAPPLPAASAWFPVIAMRSSSRGLLAVIAGPFPGPTRPPLTVNPDSVVPLPRETRKTRPAAAAGSRRTVSAAAPGPVMLT